MSLLGGGFVLLAVADCMYAVAVAHGSSRPSAMTNLAYVVAVAMLASAAWQTDLELRPRLEGWSLLLIPAGFTLVALGMLFYDHVSQLPSLAFWLAFAALVAAVIRMGLAFRDLRSLAEIRAQAVTDELTALPNRRLLLSRVRTAIAGAGSSAQSLSLLMIDLDNFKQLNDTLGHEAGDALPRLIGRRVGEVIEPTDTVDRRLRVRRPAPGVPARRRAGGTLAAADAPGRRARAGAARRVAPRRALARAGRQHHGRRPARRHVPR